AEGVAMGDRELAEEANKEKDMLSVMNISRLEERVEKKKEQRIRDKNKDLKDSVDKFTEDYKSNFESGTTKVESEFEKSGGNTKEIQRSAMLAAVAMKNLTGGSNPDMMEDFNSLSVNLETCTQEEKTRKIESFEKIFTQILSYDLKNFNLTGLKDLYGSNALKNKYICNLAMDADSFFAEYKTLLDKKDPDLALSPKQFGEVLARRNLFMSINTWTDSVGRILQTSGGMSVDIEKKLTQSLDSLSDELDALEGVVTEKSKILSALINIKSLNQSDDGVDLFGIGTGTDMLLQNERKNNIGSEPGDDDSDAALKAIKDKKAARKKEKASQKEEEIIKKDEQTLFEKGPENEQVDDDVELDDEDVLQLKEIDQMLMEGEGMTEDELKKEYEKHSRG
ncbi:MAG: hypothetical protein J6N76_10165, partial [Lachnospiraceae bacterium]|nr:hypothetical protein [Lachnospiraceae bacterium]